VNEETKILFKYVKNLSWWCAEMNFVHHHHPEMKKIFGLAQK